MTDDVTERPTRRLARETYPADPLPDLDVYHAVIDATAGTLDREVRA